MKQMEKCPGSGSFGRPPASTFPTLVQCKTCGKGCRLTKGGRLRFHKRIKPKDRRVAWRERNPLKYAAQQAVKKAIKAGLQKEPCLFCDDSDVQAHHHDYTRPLAITWLCAWHHHLAHGRTRPRRVQGAAA